MMRPKAWMGVKRPHLSIEQRSSSIRLLVGVVTFGLVASSGVNQAAAGQSVRADLHGGGFQRAAGALLALGLISGLQHPAAADPPQWAPAHGRRAKAERHEGLVFARGYGMPPGIARKGCERDFTAEGALGTLLGGLVGGVLGSTIGDGNGRIAATMGGAVLGGLAGGQVGASMAPADHLCVAKALEFVNDSQPIAWRNPDNGASYQVTPVRTERRAGGGYCREYNTTATIGGTVQRVYGTACRQPDGSWQLVE